MNCKKITGGLAVFSIGLTFIYLIFNTSEPVSKESKGSLVSKGLEPSLAEPKNKNLCTTLKMLFKIPDCGNVTGNSTDPHSSGLESKDQHSSGQDPSSNSIEDPPQNSAELCLRMKKIFRTSLDCEAVETSTEAATASTTEASNKGSASEASTTAKPHINPNPIVHGQGSDEIITFGKLKFNKKLCDNFHKLLGIDPC